MSTHNRIQPQPKKSEGALEPAMNQAERHLEAQIDSIGAGKCDVTSLFRST